MEALNQNAGAASSIEHLIEAFLAEPFAQSQNLGQETLESLQGFYEEMDEAIARGVTPDDWETLEPSYQRTKDIFCQLLLGLEGSPTAAAETLESILDRDGGTQLMSLPKAAPALQLVEDAPTPEGEEDAKALAFEALEETATPAPEEVLAWGDSVDEVQFPTEPAGQKLPEGELVFPEDLADAPLHAELVPSEGEAAEPPPNIHRTHRGPSQEALQIADTLAQVDGLSTKARDRLAAQHRIYAVEIALWERLKPAMETFWPRKESAIRELLETKPHHFDLHPLLKKGLEELSGEGEAWLPGGKVPWGSLLNSLRFLMGGPPWASFWPLPVELGVLVLLFGSERSLKGVVLRNHLNVRGLTEAELTEMAFRLFWCQVVRNRVLAPLGEEAPAETAAFCERLLELTEKIEAGPGPRKDR